MNRINYIPLLVSVVFITATVAVAQNPPNAVANEPSDAVAK